MTNCGGSRPKPRRPASPACRTRSSSARAISRRCTASPAKERDAPLERLFADVAFVAYAKTVPDKNGGVDVPDGPGLGADPEAELLDEIQSLRQRSGRERMTALNRRRGSLALPRSAGARRHACLRAQAYPQRPVKLIVPYAPGGGTDVFSRLMAQQIEREFGQTLVIDNRAGGASVIGTRAVAERRARRLHHRHDGLRVLHQSRACSRTSCPTTRARISSRCRCCRAPSSCCASIPPRRSRPRRNWSTTPRPIPASSPSLRPASAPASISAGEQFRQVAGIDIVIVPYRGGAPALADFLSGKVDFTFGAVPTIKPHIEGGKARGLGVTRGRAPQLPDIPEHGGDRLRQRRIPRARWA